MEAEIVNLGSMLKRATTHYKNGIIFLNREGKETANWRFNELDSKACSIGIFLKNQGVSHGDRIILSYPPGLDFIAAFFACCFIGAIAVPSYSLYNTKYCLEKLRYIIKDTNAKLILTNKVLYERINNWLSENYLHISCIASDIVEESPTTDFLLQPVEYNDIAMIQYTSGSTSLPKGVVVTHSNIIHNQQMIKESFKNDGDTVTVGWLPHYHDMGLIGNIMHSIYLGTQLILLSPMDFIQQPFLWLKAVSDYQATSSGGPNFAYDLCVNRISDEQKKLLNLKNWSLAFNGAETVRVDTMESFTNTFAECGFNKNVFSPCYGLAEASLIVSGISRFEGPTSINIDFSKIKDNSKYHNTEVTRETRIVNCGHIHSMQQVLTVDHKTYDICNEGIIGEIWVKGPNVAKGYWKNEQETYKTFENTIHGIDGKFLRTGDLGFILEGCLYIVGRLKEVIIVAGKNYYPQDIEYTLQKNHPELVTNGGAAFAVTNVNTQEVILVHEIKRKYMNWSREKYHEFIHLLKQSVYQNLLLKIDRVVLTKPGLIPRTTSGKIQRRKCSTLYLNKELDYIYSS
jgi:acyl-CoA synthetase (AMP-forming)/AMP-acid ligase II